MDLLYSKYSNPLEFMNLYINQGRFGEFVENIIDLENKKRQDEFKNKEEDKLFNLYVHSFSDKSFDEWKKEAIKQSNETKQTLSMTDAEVDNEVNKARNILKNFNMK